MRYIITDGQRVCAAADWAADHPWWRPVGGLAPGRLVARSDQREEAGRLVVTVWREGDLAPRAWPVWAADVDSRTVYGLRRSDAVMMAEAAVPCEGGREWRVAVICPTAEGGTLSADGPALLWVRGRTSAVIPLRGRRNVFATPYWSTGSLGCVLLPGAVFVHFRSGRSYKWTGSELVEPTADEKARLEAARARRDAQNRAWRRYASSV